MAVGVAAGVVTVGTVAVASTDEQYALSKLITVLATSVPQAPLEQSRIP